jgi:hypothetical protein
MYISLILKELFPFMEIILQFELTTFEGFISLYEKSPYIIRGITRYLCGKWEEAFIFVSNINNNFKKLFYIILTKSSKSLYMLLLFGL